MSPTLDNNLTHDPNARRMAGGIPYGGQGNSVRLPSVSILPRPPSRNDYLQIQADYSNNRRGSITDPFLHAYPQGALNSNNIMSDPSTSSTPSNNLNGMAPRRGSMDINAVLNAVNTSGSVKSDDGIMRSSSRPNSALTEGVGMGKASNSRFPGPSAGYEFGSSFGNTAGEDSSLGAARGYAAPPGGLPSHMGGGAAYRGAAPTEGTNFFDYSMRRHSLTNAGGGLGGAGGGPSPPRLPSIDANGMASASSGSLKRKNSNEEALGPNSLMEDGVSGTYSAYANPLSYGAQYPPYAKRRLSSRDGAGALLGWGEERRASSSGGPAWSTPGGFGGQYSTTAGEVTGTDYEGFYRPPTTAPYGEVPAYISRGEDHYARRPSVPSIGSIQGPLPTSAPTLSLQQPSVMYPPHHPVHDLYAGNSNTIPTGLTTPAPPHAHPSVLQPVMVNRSPATHSSLLPPHHSQPSRPSTASASYSNLPPAGAAWARAGPLPPNAHGARSSAAHSLHPNSLDPSSAYSLLGGIGSSSIGMKETPYSRSPELRVSHKLAERKRRKEMAQLFDELRDSLPSDRGLKSSKWEILSKAVDFILNLKEHNVELARDNNMLRDHFGLGPGPQSQSQQNGQQPSASPPEDMYQQQHAQQPSAALSRLPLALPVNGGPRGNDSPQLSNGGSHNSPLLPPGVLIPSPLIQNHSQGESWQGSNLNDGMRDPRARDESLRSQTSLSEIGAGSGRGEEDEEEEDVRALLEGGEI